MTRVRECGPNETGIFIVPKIFIKWVVLVMLTTGAKAAEYTLGVDSMVQPGVPQGKVTEHVWDKSRIYPGTTHEYWVYVPAQYTGAEPACVMVFQDGIAYLSTEGQVRATVVFDNLISKGEMPVTIGIFINPGKKETDWDQRPIQYVPVNDVYARFLLEEIIPEVARNYNLTDDASGRAIGGMSDGGLVSFTVAWERPDAFSKVISHIGSYTRLRGGSEYPFFIRNTRQNPKPIRVFLQDGENDINLQEGNWTLGNLSMASALMFSRYDFRLEMGTGGHDLTHGGAIFPDTVRWIWRDYPGVKWQGAGLDAVVGVWDVVTYFGSLVRQSQLTITAEKGALTATLLDEQDGDLTVTAIRFADDILRYEYAAPASQLKYSKKGETGTDTTETWLKVTGDTFQGALSSKTGKEIDFSIKGRRR